MLKCCQISTIVPNPLNRSRDSVHIIQQSLINVWQAHVRQWYRIDSIQYEHTVTHNVPDNPHSDPPSQNTIGDQPVIKRGHILRIIPSGGVFCVRCGKQTKYQKHARLKILNKQCAFLDLDPSHGLTSPGFNQPTNRSLEAEHQLNESLTMVNSGAHPVVKVGLGQRGLAPSPNPDVIPPVKSLKVLLGFYN